MTKNIFPLLLVLMFVGCGRFSDKHEPRECNSFGVSDSMWTNTGDVHLDSLLQVAATAPQDTNLIKLYFEIGAEYYRHHDDFENAKTYYFKANRLSEELNWSLGHFQFASKYTNILNKEGLMDSAIVILQQALVLAKKEMNEKWITNTTMNLGVCYYIKSWYETSLKYYHEVLPLIEKQDDRYRLAQLYDLMGILYGSLLMYDESIEYAEKSIEIWNEKPDTLLRANALINFAAVLIDCKAFEQAENCLREAQRIANLHNNKSNLVKTYSNLGYLALKKFELKKAETYYHKEFELLGSSNVESHSLVYLNLSCIEMYWGNFKKSEEYVNEALSLAIEYEFLETEKECYKNLMQLAITQHNFRLSEFYNAKADSVDRLLAYEENRKNAQEMEAKYETEKKQLEIERQQIIITKQNMQRKLFVGGISACVLILIIFWYMLRLRRLRNQSLAEINATKDKFFSIISHDLKNPAITQRDTLQLLVENAHTWDADRLADFHSELLKSAEEEVELLFNLLSWSQLQTKRISFNPETFVISDLLPNLSLIRKMAENKEITLHITIPEDALITGDRNMLATVIRNLLTNAVKFTHMGGTVALEVSPCGGVARKGVAHNAPTYKISVSDTGIGIPREEMQKIFRIDNRHSRRGTTGETGTGLGLIVCRELLEKHGTVLHVESEMEKGSRFWFEI